MVRVISSLLGVLLLAGCAETRDSKRTEQSGGARDSTPRKVSSLEEFRNKAQQFNSQISLPPLETTPEAVNKSVSNAIATANRALDRIGARASNQITFQNTIRALDDIMYQAGL